MAEDEDIRSTLDLLIAKRDKLTEAIETLQRLVDSREGGSGGEERGSVSAGNAIQRQPRAGALPTVLPGELFGQSQTDATAVYLKKVGHAVHIDQIMEALRSGGVKLGGADPKASFYTVLIRGTKRFALVAPLTFGLAEWYPNRPKKEKKTSGKKKTTKKTVSAKVKKKQVPRKQTPKKDAAKKQSAPQPVTQAVKTRPVDQPESKKDSGEPPTTKIVREILSDGKLHVLEGLIKRVQEKAGKAIPGITVKSILRRKDFEQVGTGYKLRDA